MKTLILIMILLFNKNSTALEVTTLTDTPFQAGGGLTVAANGDIFVADFGVALNNSNGTKLYKVDPVTGVVSTFATGFFGASGNVVGPDGLIYQSSISGGRVSRVSATGVVTDIATTANGLNQPVGLTFDSKGDLFVNNCGNGTISQIKTDGSVVIFVSSTLLRCPNGLTSDSDDNLYAVNFSNGNIVKITPTGVASIFATTPSSSSKPSGGNGHIIFDNDMLYLVSNATHQVFSLTLDGVLTVIAGDGIQGRDDGDVMSASFSLPNGIGISPNGTKLYVNDSDVVGSNNQISPNVVRVIEIKEQIVPDPIIIPNDGLTGAWFNTETSGQGMLININTDANLFFTGWFTYDDQMPSSNRWLTAQGPIDESGIIDVPIFNTSGGVFDADNPVTSAIVGQLTIKFLTCTTALLTYSFDNGLANQIDLTRLTTDIYCETLLISK